MNTHWQTCAGNDAAQRWSFDAGSGEVKPAANAKLCLDIMNQQAGVDAVIDLCTATSTYFFGPYPTPFAAPHRSTRAVCSAYAHWKPIDACNPMLCPNSPFQGAAITAQTSSGRCAAGTRCSPLRAVSAWDTAADVRLDPARDFLDFPRLQSVRQGLKASHVLQASWARPRKKKKITGLHVHQHMRRQCRGCSYRQVPSAQKKTRDICFGAFNWVSGSCRK